MKGIRYTAIEKERLTAAYRAGGLKSAYAAYPDRAPVGIRDLLKRLGVHKPKTAKPWTTGDERTATAMWQAGARARDIAAAIGHPYASVLQHFKESRERLGLKPRCRPPAMTRGQLQFVARTMEHALDHIAATTGKGRGAVKTAAVRYLMLDARRRRASAITDLGGMSPHTTPRAQSKRKAAA